MVPIPCPAGSANFGEGFSDVSNCSLKKTFSFTGSLQYLAVEEATTFKVTMWAGGGGGGGDADSRYRSFDGGAGGFTQGYFVAPENSVLQVLTAGGGGGGGAFYQSIYSSTYGYTGRPGYGGGGSGTGNTVRAGGGGGRSSLRVLGSDKSRMGLKTGFIVTSAQTVYSINTSTALKVEHVMDCTITAAEMGGLGVGHGGVTVPTRVVRLSESLDQFIIAYATPASCKMVLAQLEAVNTYLRVKAISAGYVGGLESSSQCQTETDINSHWVARTSYAIATSSGSAGYGVSTLYVDCGVDIAYAGGGGGGGGCSTNVNGAQCNDGSSKAMHGGAGGGLTGVSGGSTVGQGGTQTAPGSSYVDSYRYVNRNWYPIAAKSHSGGSGSLHGGGGGGGWYGGGSATWGSGLTYPGGGGSGYMSPKVSAGETMMGSGGAPPRANHALYEAGVGVGGAGSGSSHGYGGDGGPGLVVLEAVCPAGYYCPAGAPAPLLCPRGNYCVSNSSTPTPCPAGSARFGSGFVDVTDCSFKQLFTYTGALQYFDSESSGTYTAKLWAGGGGGSGTRRTDAQTYSGGSGGFTLCVFNASAGEQVEILVGGGGGGGTPVTRYLLSTSYGETGTPGYGGGGYGTGHTDWRAGGGGGRSHIFSLSKGNIAYAGGGGGAGHCHVSTYSQCYGDKQAYGGSGGGLIGQQGAHRGGYGGTQSSVGSAVYVHGTTASQSSTTTPVQANGHNGGSGSTHHGELLILHTFCPFSDSPLRTLTRYFLLLPSLYREL